MKHLNLGPHTYMSPQPHGSNHEWLKRFSPRERHQMIQEDVDARKMTIGIITGVILFGLSMLIVVLTFAR